MGFLSGLHLKSNFLAIHEMVASGKVAVVGAYYDLDTGKVEFFKD